VTGRLRDPAGGRLSRDADTSPTSLREGRSPSRATRERALRAGCVDIRIDAGSPYDQVRLRSRRCARCARCPRCPRCAECARAPILDLWCRNCRCDVAFVTPDSPPQLQDRRVAQVVRPGGRRGGSSRWAAAPAPRGPGGTARARRHGAGPAARRGPGGTARARRQRGLRPQREPRRQREPGRNADGSSAGSRPAVSQSSANPDRNANPRPQRGRSPRGRWGGVLGRRPGDRVVAHGGLRAPRAVGCARTPAV
jgi:hypothetical protein